MPVVGIIGGGQLARMTAPPAIALGVRLRVLAAEPDDSAAQVVVGASVGDHRDAEAVTGFARGCDVVTFDHEHVPQPLLEHLVADGVAVRPRPQALRLAQDKAAMRSCLTSLGVPCPRWRLVRDAAELASFAAEVGWPVVLKTPRGGYDGKGVLVAEGPEDAAEWLAHAGGPSGAGVLAEERVAFARELAVLVARSPSGQAAAWPVVETVQVDGICREVTAPAPGLDPGLAAEATRIGLRIAGELDVVGVLAVEMFQTPGVAGGGEARVLVNELAMRPHNCGHWTIDGAVTSQFEQHLRAVLDLPLGRSAAPGALVGDGQRARRRPAGPVRRLPARDGPRPGCQGAPVREAGAARSQGRPRHGVRRRPGGLPGTRAARRGLPERDDHRIDPDGRGGRGGREGSGGWDSRWSAW